MSGLIDIGLSVRPIETPAEEFKPTTIWRRGLAARGESRTEFLDRRCRRTVTITARICCGSTTSSTHTEIYRRIVIWHSDASELLPCPKASVLSCRRQCKSNKNLSHDLQERCNSQRSSTCHVGGHHG